MEAASRKLDPQAAAKRKQALASTDIGQGGALQAEAQKREELHARALVAL